MRTRSCNIRNRKKYGQGWYGKKGKRIKIVNLLYGYQNSKCNICKVVFEKEKLQLDHIIPLIEGGKHNISNMQLLCNPCHIEKDRITNINHGGNKHTNLHNTKFSPTNSSRNIKSSV